MNRDQFFKKIDSFNDELIHLRRHIHAHPELSGSENQTAILISGFLKNIGWNVRESIGRTGVVADFGPLDNGIIGLRVDMDALPIFEETKLSFSSKVDGVMHACGHDLHISIGLGVAKIVKDLKLNFGTRIIFQPAEEIASGARWMIKDGATNGLTHILGVHVYPDLCVGTIGIKEGSLTAAAGELKVEIKGKILKELGVATGIFVAINGGLAIALRSVIRLTAFVSRVAFTNLLARPIRAIFDLIARGTLLKGLSNAAGGSSGGVPPGVPGGGDKKTKTTQKGKVKSSKSFGLGRYFFPTATGAFRVFDEYQSGERDPAKLAIAGLIDTASVLLLNRLKLPFIATAGLFAISRGPVDSLIDASQKFISGDTIDQIGGQVQDRQLELRNKSNKVVVVDDENEDTNVVTGSAGIADASALLAVASGNSDNPYIMNSIIQYNIIL